MTKIIHSENIIIRNITLDDLNHAEVIENLPLLILFVLIMTLGIVGNTLVLFIYKFKFKQSSSHVYILMLAVADLSVCVVGIPYHIMDMTMVLTYTNATVCKILTFLVSACTMSSVLVLLMVGLDRYLKVCRPFKRQIRDFGDGRACMIAIALAVFIYIPNSILYGNSTVATEIDGVTGVECFVSDYYDGSMFATVFYVLNILVFSMAVVFLTIIYGLIIKKIYDNGKTKGVLGVKSQISCCACLSMDNESISNETLDEQCQDLHVTPVPGNKSSNESLVAYSENEQDESTSANVLVNNANITTVCNQDIREQTSEGNIETSKADLNEGNRHGTINKSDSPKDGISSAKMPKSNKSSKTKQKAKAKQQKHRPSETIVRHGAGGKHTKNPTRKITLIMLTITIVFVVTYFPYIVILVLDSMIDGFWADMSHFERVFHNFLLRLYLVNNMANPFIYGFWDERFRFECIKIIKAFCCFKTDGKLKL